MLPLSPSDTKLMVGGMLQNRLYLNAGFMTSGTVAVDGRLADFGRFSNIEPSSAQACESAVIGHLQFSK